MKIGIPKEIVPHEHRVAATPDTVAKMVQAGLEVYVESDAGVHAYHNDDAFQQAGARIISHPQALYETSNIILKIQPPIVQNGQNEIDHMNKGCIFIGLLFPFSNISLIEKLNQKNISAFALDLLPRLARTQSMDVLSSMSNIAGYKSVIIAANYLNKLFPMMITAAGTIRPVKTIVLGAGVAGLQAIATARRLGSVVFAFDTRPIVEEQVKSLGAEFVSLKTSHDAQDEKGYAKEQSADYYQHEQAVIQQYLQDADVIISTALVPGKRAPILLTEEMLKIMKPGSVIVDLAAEQGGNCALTEPGEIIVKNNITIVGLLNLPSTLPIHASQLFSKNIFTFLNYIINSINTGFDFSDDIIKSCLVTHQGTITHPHLQQSIQQQGLQYAQ